MNQSRNPRSGTNIGIAIGVGVGFLVLIGVVIAMGIAVGAKRRRALALQDAGLLHVDAAAAAADAPVALGTFIISGDHVILYDSKASNEEASRIAAARDGRAFGRHTLAHGVPVSRGERVRIVEGGALQVRVETISTGISGWTDREFIKPE